MRPQSVEDDTRQRLLDAAEALFAECGFASTSLRAITGLAKANLAAINYHFGSKDELIRAVFARRLQPLNAERLMQLAALEASGRPLTVEEVLAAFIEPSLRLQLEGVQGARFTRLLGRAQTEASESLHEFLRDHYAPVMVRFQQTLARILPQLSAEELTWRLQFTLGVLLVTYGGVLLPRAPFISQSPQDAEWFLRRLILFLAAGLRAPPTPQVLAETAT